MAKVCDKKTDLRQNRYRPSPKNEEGVPLSAFVLLLPEFPAVEDILPDGIEAAGN
jgi:hypothetical protein